MQSSVASFPAAGAARVTAQTKAQSLPWLIYAVVLGAACIPIGALWDISWHSTIGRDSFWTPAHMMIYLGGALPGFACGWLALKTSFWGTEEERAASVQYLGFRAPLGAWITIWGAMTMLVSAPFDNWWHDAYGLDVEILSPPHTLLALGMYAVANGAMALASSWQNRHAETRKSAGRLFLFSMGVLLVMASIILTEESYPNAQRNGMFYTVSSIYALGLCFASRASASRWGATWAATVFMGLILMMVWGLPLFKAQPLLAPIYIQVDRMVPPIFPLFLIVPALAIDLINQKFSREGGFLRDTLLACVLGAAFFILLLAVQWNFSAFLLSDAADNWFFAGGRQWPYFIKPGPWRDEFWTGNGRGLHMSSAAIALSVTILFSRLGLGIGTWMKKVAR